MPIYEFTCERCQHEFEELVFGDTAPECPQCGASETQKLMSRTCVHYGQSYGAAPASSSGGKSCAGCSGGNCASCH